MSVSSQPLTKSAEHAAAPEAPRRGGMFAPLGNRDYRLLFAGQLISLIGDAFYAVALPWHMLTRGGGVANLGLVLTAYGVPMGAATLLGGWLSDTLRPRRVMLFSDFIRTFILAGLAWLTFGAGAPFWHSAPLWSVAAFTATLGLFDGIFMPASNAITPDLLPDDQLQAANGLFFSIARFAQMTATEVAFPAMANGPLHTDAQGFGLMLAASGAGGLAGGLLAGALGNRINRGVISLLFSAFQVIPIVALAFAPPLSSPSAAWGRSAFSTAWATSPSGR